MRELWSPARQQIWLEVGQRSSSRSRHGTTKVTVKVTTWYHRKGLVTKNTHAKYQSSICNSAKVMAKVKVFVTDRQRDRRTDGRMRFNVPTLSRKGGTKMQKLLSIWKIRLIKNLVSEMLCSDRMRMECLFVCYSILKYIVHSNFNRHNI